LENQPQAIQSAVCEIFNKELRREVNQVVTQLERTARLVEPGQNPWMPWLTHGAAFLTDQTPNNRTMRWRSRQPSSFHDPPHDYRD
jgi:hypothetical protein